LAPPPAMWGVQAPAVLLRRRSSCPWTRRGSARPGSPAPRPPVRGLGRRGLAGGRAGAVPWAGARHAHRRVAAARGLALLVLTDAMGLLVAWRVSCSRTRWRCWATGAAARCRGLALVMLTDAPLEGSRRWWPARDGVLPRDRAARGLPLLVLTETRVLLVASPTSSSRRRTRPLLELKEASALLAPWPLSSSRMRSRCSWLGAAHPYRRDAAARGRPLLLLPLAMALLALFVASRSSCSPARAGCPRPHRGLPLYHDDRPPTPGSPPLLLCHSSPLLVLRLLPLSVSLSLYPLSRTSHSSFHHTLFFPSDSFSEAVRLLSFSSASPPLRVALRALPPFRLGATISLILLTTVHSPITPGGELRYRARSSYYY
jgi:hypothetical protein